MTTGDELVETVDSLGASVDAHLERTKTLTDDRDELLELVRSLHRVCRASDVRYGGSALETDVRAALDKKR